MNTKDHMCIFFVKWVMFKYPSINCNKVYDPIVGTFNSTDNFDYWIKLGNALSS